MLVVFLLHGPLGGVTLQATLTTVNYVGVSIVALFNPTVRHDLQSIYFNPFNPDAEKVLTADTVAFYRGVPVFKMAYPRSGSFGVILLYRSTATTSAEIAAGVNDVRHEWGHTVQQAILGPLTYLTAIGLPSAAELSHRDYYDRPWEITADAWGGVARTHTATDLTRGRAYLLTALLGGPLSYFFLIGEYA